MLDMARRKLATIKISGHSFKSFQCLYCDPNYLQFNFGGLIGANLEVNLLVATLGSSQTSPQREFLEKKLKKPSTSITDVCTKIGEIVITGYVSFDIVAYETEIDGVPWIGAIVMDERTHSIIANTPWTIVVFRKDSFKLDRKYWHDFSQPINILSEVFSANVQTPYGNKICYLIARGAAFAFTY